MSEWTKTEEQLREASIAHLMKSTKRELAAQLIAMQNQVGRLEKTLDDLVGRLDRASDNAELWKRRAIGLLDRLNRAAGQPVFGDGWDPTPNVWREHAGHAGDSVWRWKQERDAYLLVLIYGLQYGWAQVDCSPHTNKRYGSSVSSVELVTGGTELERVRHTLREVRERELRVVEEGS